MAMAYPDSQQRSRGARSKPSHEQSMELLGILTRANTLPPRDEITIGTNDLVPAVFIWKTHAKEVLIAGTFDNWTSRIPLIKSHGEFYVIVHVPKGKYQYLYCVDDQWMTDPSQKIVIENGQPRNVIQVRSDYKTYRALAIDGKKVDEYKDLSYHRVCPKDVTKGKPPLLPLQMLQIILNKDTPPEIHPMLLPKPDHIMLNHLYVLMSHGRIIDTPNKEIEILPEKGYHTITRFRKVFVATVFYYF